MRSRFFKQGNDLLTLHAGKALQKLLDRVTRFQMIEQALRWHPGSCKYRLPPEDFRILRDHAAHA